MAAEKVRAMMMMSGRPPPGLGPMHTPMSHPGAGQLFPGAALAAALAASGKDSSCNKSDSGSAASTASARRSISSTQ